MTGVNPAWKCRATIVYMADDIVNSLNKYRETEGRKANSSGHNG